MTLRNLIVLRAIASILLVLLLSITSDAQAVPPAWRVNNPSFADFASRMSDSIEKAIPGMPFYTSNQTRSPAFVPLDFRYLAENVPASPITTQPMSKVGLLVSWTVNLNNDNIWLYVIPGSSLDSEFIRRNEIRRCSFLTIDNGQPAFGSASCNSSSGSGSRGDSSMGGARYVGSAAISVLRSCGLITVNTQLTTHSPPSAGLDPRQDAINESRALASKYTKDIMQKLLAAFDPVCAFGPNYPTPTPTPRPTYTPTPTPTPRPDRTPTPTPTPLATPVPGNVRPLKLFFSAERNENFTTGTDIGEQGARAFNYGFVRTEGFVYADQVVGTVPLKLFFNDALRDNFSTATADGERDALGSGYRFIRIEGYVFPTRQPQTMPLKLFYSDSRRDNFTTATADGSAAAMANGYREIRTEGYVLTASGSIDNFGTRWDESESGFAGTWIRRGSSNVWDASWGNIRATLTITIIKNQVRVERRQGNDGNSCDYVGVLTPDGGNIKGTYSCSNGATNIPWTAVIRN